MANLKLASGLSDFISNESELVLSFPSGMLSKVLDKVNEPLQSDTDYLDLIITIFTIQRQLFKLQHRMEKVHAIPKNTPEYNVHHLAIMISKVERLLSLLEDIISHRLELTKNTPKFLLPRIERLTAKLNVSKKETRALCYTIVAASEQFDFSYHKKSKSYSFEFPILIKYSNMTFSEGLAFMRSSKPLVKENIFHPDEDDPLRYSVQVPFSTICVLSGTELSTEELLKIDKTALAALIEDEKSLKGETITSPPVEEKIEKVEQVEEEKKEKEEKDIFDIIRDEVEAEKLAEKPIVESTTDPSDLLPYTSNIEYLADHIDWISLKIRVKNMAKDLEEDLTKDPRTETQLRELRAKERMFAGKCSKRLELTAATKWMPRLEKLAKKLEISEFEKNIVITLVGNPLTPRKISPRNSRYSSSSFEEFTVGDLLSLFCASFEEEIKNRCYFYKNAKLIKEGIIKLADRFEAELVNTQVHLDRRMMDFIVGLDTELSELVEGSHIYSPQVDLNQVILPDEQKNLILNTVTNYEFFSKAKKKLGFDEVITYGGGMILLFYGKSGTGKTMMANAIGKHLGKRILLVNYPSLGNANSADLVLKFIFREAKLQDAIIFFDECESIFLSRDLGGKIQLVLTELERHSGLVIMATNRAFDLDEAMHRRITMAVEFRSPDHLLREKIWKSHIPSEVKLAQPIDWKYLSIKYELTGGFIKNAILSALSSAISRDKNNIEINQKDLETGALHQLRGRLAMVEFDRRVVPTRGLDSIIANKDVSAKLNQIVSFEKARQVLFGEWGFSEQVDDQGVSALFYGNPGTGKTLAAKAIGFETGRPLKIVNVAELVSKYVGDTGKNIDSVFKEARMLDAILVFDEAEGLFGRRSSSQDSSTDRYANMDTGLLLYHMEKFPGLVILTTNLADSIDHAFFRRFRFVVEFTNPDAQAREKLWIQHLPASAPKDKNIDYKSLASRFSFSGGHIKNACIKAAARASLRSDSERVIRMEDLIIAGIDEDNAIQGKAAPTPLYL